MKFNLFAKKHMSCAKCNSPPQLPVVLECGDIYCFLCLKQKIQKTQETKCNNCQKLIDIEIDNISQDFRDTLANLVTKPVWMYSSKSQDGWWMYNIETLDAIERCYENDLPMCSFMIADKTYKIMFDTNIQSLVSLSDGSGQPKQRIVKRVLFSEQMIDQINIKGIAGLFFKTIEDEIGKFV